MGSKRWKNIARLFLPLLLILITGAILLSANTSFANSNSLRVSYIDVGQGDAILLSDSNGFDILIDGGRASAGPTVVAYIREQAIDDIDVMIASHAHADHIGGLIDVLEASDIIVESVMYNGYPGDTATWYSFATAVANDGLVLTPLQFPDEISWGLMTAYVLNPDPGLINPDQNNASVVILIDHGEVGFLFTGEQ